MIPGDRGETRWDIFVSPDRDEKFTGYMGEIIPFDRDGHEKVHTLEQNVRRQTNVYIVPG